MFKKIGLLITSLFVFCVLAGCTLVVSAATTTPDPTDPLGELCRRTDTSSGVDGSQDTEICQINEADKANADTQGILGSNGIVKKVLNLMSWLTGLLATVFIIIGGFKFTVSGGNSDSVKSAKNMIIYACVGIVVVLLSNVIINFVLGIVNKTNN